MIPCFNDQSVLRQERTLCFRPKADPSNVREGGTRTFEAGTEPTARLMFAAIDEAADSIAGGADRAAILSALQRLLRRTFAPATCLPNCINLT